MGESKGEDFEELLRRLAEAPASDLPSHVRPGVVLAERLEVEQQLGVGGMGRVFAAYDRVRRGKVAVKVLGCLSPQSITQLKREFRAVAELVHPNLVRCHELFSDGFEWFFTMDLIDGLGLSAFLKAAGGPPWDALREVLRQLAVALRALHEAGMLHGDLKPSNFLITRDEHRVVLLDFGLAQPIGLAAPGEGIGTPGYMAPEQLRGRPWTEAVDWYAFGVVLHRALTGELPSAGETGARLAEAPEDLGRLCLELLRPDPADRPGGPEVVRRIGRPAGAPVASRAPELHRPILVGREEELAALERAYQRALSGQPSVALVLGPSGIGKTSLATAFLNGVRDRGGFTLSSSCRERESMAYKAADGLVDGIVGLLDALPDAEASALLPRHVAELTVLFPALRQALILARAPAADVESSDRTVVRLRAIAAFGELLANLRRRAPLVVWIDDLQWSDAESALLLGPVLGGADPVPLLLVGGCRTGTGAPAMGGRQPSALGPPPGPMLEVLLGARDLAVPRPDEISLSPLGREAAERLALELLPRAAPGSRAAAHDIAQEADGHPLFITELAHAAGAGEPSRGPGPSTLQELIVRRVAGLPAEARSLLEMTAVAGAPLPRGVLHRTQGATYAEGEASLDLLRASRLVRTQGLKEEDVVDVHHDRIREIVVHELGEVDRRRCHLTLARVLETRAEGQPEFVAAHYEAAGDPVLASRYWALAADQSARALAFDHAADLYGKALVHARLEPGALRALRIGRAEALARAGKGPAAAEVYLATAEDCARDEAVELRRRAAEQLLLSGHLGSGLEVIEQVLRAIGMRGTRTGRRGLLSFVAGRVRVRARGLHHLARGEHELSREELVQLDASWTIACSLGGVDFIRGADFQNEHLLLALRAGEPRRLLRALTLEVSYSATPGLGSERRTARVLALADALAGTGADDVAIAFLSVARGLAAYLQGRLDQAAQQLQGAIDLMARRGAGTVLETVTAQRFLVASLFFLGRFERLRKLVPPLLADAEGSGNVYATMCFRTGYSTAVWLAGNDVREARRQLQRAREEWEGVGYQLAHVNMLIGETHLDLYTGDPERALARLDAQWPDIREAQMLRIAVLRAQLLQLRSASAVAAADMAEARGQWARAALLRRRARADARRLRRERILRAVPWAALAEAAAEWSAGDDASARARLEEAVAGFDRQGMQLYAAAARVRMGERTRLHGGASLAQAGREVFAREDVANPARLVGMLAPGFGSTLAW